MVFPELAVALAGVLLLAAVGALAIRERARRAVVEARARTAEKRFDLLAGSAASWLWETDAEMRLTWVSHLPGGADPGEVLGRRRDEFPGLEDDRALWQQHQADLAARRGFDDFVFSRDVPGIGRRTVRVSGHPVYDDGGSFRGYRGTGSDVTGEFAAKAEAESAERRLLDAINALSSGFALYTPDDRLALCNRRFTEIYPTIAPVARPGGTFEEIVRMTATTGLVKAALADPEAWVTERLAQHRGDSGSLEMALTDGRFMLVGDHRARDGYRVSIHTDITEVRTREMALALQSSLLSTTIDSIAEALVVVDKDLRLALWNPRYQTLFDLPDWLMQVGMPIATMFRHNAMRGEYGPGDIETLVAGRMALVTSSKVTPYEYTRPNGMVLEVRRSYPAGGGFLTTFADITERKRFENALQSAKEQAELANRAKTAFLANMSHELRTPLNAIIGFAEIIREQLLGPIGTPKYLDYMADIHLSGNHLLEVINDILDLSKVESGHFELLEKTIDLERVLASALRLLGDKAAKGGLTIRSRMPEPRPLIRADERGIKQILLNLLSNSVKFTRPGGVIEVTAELAPDGDLLLIVADTGIGFDLADLPRALAPFGQIDSSLTRRYQGTGLGLPLVNSLTQLHGGRLEFDSKIDVGTRVTVRLPVARVVPFAAVERAALAAEPT
ncbi:MAG: PAS-domain containing protein [Proteobacteria bacterium]|nr:PAS-domain containing protein [Pseudomonadota bacterium]